MTAHWLYNRINVPVTASREDVMARLDAWANGEDGPGTGVIGGAAMLTDEHRDAIMREHDESFVIYGMVMGGSLA